MSGQWVQSLAPPPRHKPLNVWLGGQGATIMLAMRLQVCDGGPDARRGERGVAMARTGVGPGVGFL